MRVNKMNNQNKNFQVNQQGEEFEFHQLIVSLQDLDWQVSQAANETLLNEGTIVVAPLIAALNNNNSYLRATILEILGAIGDGRAIEPIIMLLNDKDDKVREEAANALGRLGAKQATEPLTKLLFKDGNRYVRRKAAEALTLINDERSIDTLIEALNDEDIFVRAFAAEGLGYFDSEKAVSALMQAQKTETEEIIIRTIKESIKRGGKHIT